MVSEQSRPAPSTLRRRAIAGVAVVAAAVAAVAAVPAPAAAAPSPVRDPVAYVNPLIGSANAGNTYPGAVRPFGMLAWSPQNTTGGISTPAPGGYRYDATKIRGFSLTHLSGIGCYGANGDIPIMPYVGAVDSSPSADSKDAKYASTFSHDNETARAGYYRVGLDSGASAELTATERTGSGRFGFPAGKPASMLFRTSNSETGSTDATVEVDAAHHIVTGSVTAGNFCGPQSANNRHDNYTLYFTAHFDRSFAGFGTWHDGTLNQGSSAATGGTGFDGNGIPAAGKGSGAYVTFPDGTTKVGVKVAISYVSAANAERNLRTENPAHTSFDRVRSDAAAAWRQELKKVAISGGTDEQRTTFYTALYHSMLEPTLTSDVDGRYLGADRKPHRLTGRQHAQYGTFSGWDQYRAQVQLLTLLNPRIGSDYAQSMFNYAGQRGGEWDRWLLENGKTSVMAGDPAAAAVAAIYAFGGRDFDARGALRSLITAATVPTANDSSSAGCNVECVGERPALDKYLKLGYVPADGCHCWGGAAETLEDAAADFALAELSGQLGDRGNERTFRDRAGAWSNVFDLTATPQGGYMRNRAADGNWSSPSFSPGTGDGFVEGTSARYTWMVYSDVAGLVDALGGLAAAEQRLDNFFRTADGRFDFSGSDGTRYDPTNEPDINAPYLYDYVGAPYKTQQTVRAEMAQLWTNTPGGIPGNDDAGTMSSWYVFSALGMYPQVPSRADLVLTTPLFPHAVIRSGHGRPITIDAPGASADNTYIRSVRVDGKSSSRPWVPASFVTSGGRLEFSVGSTPNTRWGAAATDAPPSFRHGERPFLTGVDPLSAKVEPGGTTKANYLVQALGSDARQVQWKAAAPDGIQLSPAAGTVTLNDAGRGSVPLTVTPSADVTPGRYSITLTAQAPDGTALPDVSFPVTVATKGSVLWNLNNNGISADDEQPQANFDGEGWSYSATALAAAGVRPGGTVSANGFDFAWPNVQPGDPDNIAVGGGDQVLSVPGGDASKLSFLGSAAEGNASGTITLTYTDGSTQTATIGFSDWTLGGGSQQPAYGNITAVRTPYRDVLGDGKDMVATYLFATAPIALQSGKQLASVTLPAGTQGGDIHLFAVATA
ncbi:GH92 family glycosyl hydrolase [Actinocatenispora comari]|uniref:Alpha-1,2-mannosidase n=1 Tax=Actinocatenispora comari TaxID=2807577 RepID=A0A8J4EKG0_9ACTN|nr:GH92 family glycosyl hydrolase [Actinocatenispora comari]GIL28162.1 alpha-1,2-mannosidase [Actinocatenispora comari]